MKKSIIFFSVIALMLTFSCKNVVKVDIDSEIQSIRQTMNSVIEVMNNKDINRFMNFYDSAAIYVESPNILRGKEEIQKAYEQGFSLPDFSITGQIQDIQVTKAGDFGYTIVPFDGQWKAESGELMKQHGINLLVWKKQADGSWKILIDKP